MLRISLVGESLGLTPLAATLIVSCQYLGRVLCVITFVVTFKMVSSASGDAMSLTCLVPLSTTAGNMVQRNQKLDDHRTEFGVE